MKVIQKFAAVAAVAMLSGGNVLAQVQVSPTIR
jgi:hypothetical protein